MKNEYIQSLLSISRELWAEPLRRHFRAAKTAEQVTSLFQVMTQKIESEGPNKNKNILLMLMEQKDTGTLNELIQKATTCEQMNLVFKAACTYYGGNALWTFVDGDEVAMFHILMNNATTPEQINLFFETIAQTEALPYNASHRSTNAIWRLAHHGQFETLNAVLRKATTPKQINLVLQAIAEPCEGRHEATTAMWWVVALKGHTTLNAVIAKATTSEQISLLLQAFIPKYEGEALQKGLNALMRLVTHSDYQTLNALLKKAKTPQHIKLLIQAMATKKQAEEHYSERDDSIRFDNAFQCLVNNATKSDLSSNLLIDIGAKIKDTIETMQRKISCKDGASQDKTQLEHDLKTTRDLVFEMFNTHRQPHAFVTLCNMCTLGETREENGKRILKLFGNMLPQKPETQSLWTHVRAFIPTQHPERQSSFLPTLNMIYGAIIEDASWHKTNAFLTQRLKLLLGPRNLVDYFNFRITLHQHIRQHDIKTMSTLPHDLYDKIGAYLTETPDTLNRLHRSNQLITFPEEKPDESDAHATPLMQ